LHRLNAATDLVKPPRQTFDAYVVVEPDPYRRDLLMRSINCIEGRGQTRDENLAHCVEMHRLYGGPIEDLAAAFGLKPSAVKDHLRLVKLDERAEQWGVAEQTRKLTQKVKQALSQIKNDPVFAKTVRVITATKASTAAALQLARDTGAARSERAALKILEDREQEYAEQEERARARYGKRRPDIPATAMKPVRTILNFSAKHGNDPAKLQWGALDEAQLTRDLKVVDEVVDILVAWKREMQTIQKQYEKAKAWKPLTTGEPASASSSLSV
jgi:hypothetical protein